MQTTIGNITGYVDLAQILLYVFWLFFAGLIYYLVQENHREGYPMESGSSGRAVVKGFPIPEPKTFLLAGGHSVTVPDLARKEPPIHGASTGMGSGSPIDPTGDAMTSGVGAGAWSMREDVPGRQALAATAACRQRLHRGRARRGPARSARHGRRRQAGRYGQRHLD